MIISLFTFLFLGIIIFYFMMSLHLNVVPSRYLHSPSALFTSRFTHYHSHPEPERAVGEWRWRVKEWKVNRHDVRETSQEKWKWLDSLWSCRSLRISSRGQRPALRTRREGSDMGERLMSESSSFTRLTFSFLTPHLGSLGIGDGMEWGEMTRKRWG